MKRFMVTAGLMMNVFFGSAQSYEIEVLLLNVEKLHQMKQILQDMKDGYEIVSKGYGLVKDISKGNFSLHDLFLDRMMSASPAVRNNYKVGEILQMQVSIVQEYKQGWKSFHGSKWLRDGEIKYIGSLYAKLFASSAESLDGLTVVISGRSFRMTDDERLTRIDRIHDRMKKRLVDVRKINASCSGVIYEREKGNKEIDLIGKFYGINK